MHAAAPDAPAVLDITYVLLLLDMMTWLDMTSSAV
jgi:hypothetical protein